ncbi:MAG: D-hexose-6-phosphate mutarotase [Psychrobium sp.]
MTTASITLSDTAAYYDSEEALPLIIVTSPRCTAVISLYGGQVLEFQATNRQPLLWLSDSAVFKTGVAIRGGVPICAPWFGNHPTHKLNHGFARTSLWQQQSINHQENGNIEINLALQENELSRAHGFQQFTMKLAINLGNELAINFSVENHGNMPLICEWAMHSYFYVNDIEDTTISGLEGYTFLDKTEQNNAYQLEGVQHFNGEVDSAFINASHRQTVHCDNSTINVIGDNSPSAIVWNPGADLATKMNDISHYQRFVCLERGAINTNAWQVSPDKAVTALVVMSN